MSRATPNWLRIGTELRMDGWSWKITKLKFGDREVYLEYCGKPGLTPSEPRIWCNMDELIEGPYSGLCTILEHGGAA